METVGQVIRMDNLREGYVAICQAVALQGEEVSPRGNLTREFRNTTIIVENPLDTMPTGVGRGFIPGIAAVESAQLLAGESRANLVMKVGPTFANFVEDDGEFWGAYGRRTAGQFEKIERRLKADPSSRQARVTIWDPTLDLDDGRKDFPCTTGYEFQIRKDRLHMTVFMRSNDVWLGLAYDGFQHSRVQLAMASVLGIEPGEYTHFASSLHAYERDFDKIWNLHMPDGKPKLLPAITGSTWSDVQTRGQVVLNYAEQDDAPSAITDMVLADSMQWYINSMREAIQKNEEK